MSNVDGPCDFGLYRWMRHYIIKPSGSVTCAFSARRTLNWNGFVPDLHTKRYYHTKESIMLSREHGVRTTEYLLHPVRGVHEYNHGTGILMPRTLIGYMTAVVGLSVYFISHYWAVRLKQVPLSPQSSPMSSANSRSSSSVRPVSGLLGFSCSFSASGSFARTTACKRSSGRRDHWRMVASILTLTIVEPNNKSPVTSSKCPEKVW